MIKTGKRKLVSIIVVLAMVIGMIPMGAIAAFADTSVTGATGTKVTGGKTDTVVSGMNANPIKNQTASNITIKEPSDDKAQWSSGDIEVTVTLEDGAVFSKKPTVKLGDAAVTASMTSVIATGGKLTFTISGDDDVQDTIVISGVKVNVGAVDDDELLTVDVASDNAIFTTDAEEPLQVDIAKVKPGLNASAAGDGEDTTLDIGENDQDTALITLAETEPDQLKADDSFSIALGDGYTYYEPPVIADNGELELVTNVGTLSADRKTASWKVSSASVSDEATMTVTPALNVASTVVSGSDVNVTFTTDNADIAIAPSPLKVAEASLGDDISYTASAAPSISKSANQATGSITIEESEAELLGEGTVILTIENEGVTFASTPQATPSGGLTLLDSDEEEQTTAQPGNLEEDLDEATWTIGSQSTGSGGSIVISGIVVNVASGAATGALRMTLSGTANADKTLTVANISSAATVEVTASGTPAVKVNTANQAAGNITIKESKAGAIAAGEGKDITLKIFGITSDEEVLFAELPTVSVTSGNIVLGTVAWVNSDNHRLGIKIPVTTASGTASTIEITGIKYDVNAQAVEGSVQVIVSNGDTRLASVSNATVSKTGQTFSDVASTFWAATYINKLSTKGIMSGYPDGTFKPNNSITRAEFAKVVVEAAGLTLVNPATPSFSDVPTSHWAYKYIETAKAAGAIGGYPDGTFRPSANVTRAEMSKMIVEAGKITIDESGAGFSDTAGNWAEKYIKTVANKGIAGGYPDGTFKPSNNATRAEASKMVAVWQNL